MYYIANDVEIEYQSHTMLAPPTPSTWPTFGVLLEAIQSHAKVEGYVVIKERIKKNKVGELVKVYFRCDRGGKYKDEASEEGRRQ